MNIGACTSEWYGPGCSIELERDCDDKKDNDNGRFRSSI